MVDKPQEQSKSSDKVDEKAVEKPEVDAGVAKNSQTDAKGKKEIEETNKDASSGSLGFDKGITAIRFEIAENGETIASKDVTSDKNESEGKSLTVELKAIKQGANKEQADLAQNIEMMRNQAKEKGISTETIDNYAKEGFSNLANQDAQFKRGSHQALKLESAEDSSETTSNQTNQPLGGYEQIERPDGGITLKGVILERQVGTRHML